jgi:hypothetical protein
LFKIHYNKIYHFELFWIKVPIPIYRNKNLTLTSKNNIFQTKYGEHIECEIEFNPINVQDKKLKIYSSNLEKFELTFRNNKFIHKNGPIYSANLIKQEVKIKRDSFEDRIISNYFFGRIKIDTSYLNENDEYSCCLEEVSNVYNKICSFLKFKNESINHIFLNPINIDIEEIYPSLYSSFSKHSIFYSDYLKPILILCLFILTLAVMVLVCRIKSHKNTRSIFEQKPNLFTITQKNNQNAEYPQPNLVNNLYSKYNLNNSKDYKLDIDEFPPAYHEIHDNENHI